MLGSFRSSRGLDVKPFCLGEVTTTTARTERSTFHELEPLLLKINHQGPGVIDESMVKKMLANDSYDVVIPNPAQGYCPCGNYDGDYKALPSRSRKTLRPWMALIRITGEGQLTFFSLGKVRALSHVAHVLHVRVRSQAHWYRVHWTAEER